MLQAKTCSVVRLECLSTHLCSPNLSCCSLGVGVGVNSRLPRLRLGTGSQLPPLLSNPPPHPSPPTPRLLSFRLKGPEFKLFILGLSQSKQHKVNKTRKEASQVRWKRKLGSHNTKMCGLSWMELCVSPKSKTLGLRLGPASLSLRGRRGFQGAPQWTQARD